MVSLIHGGSTLSGGGGESSVRFFVHLDVEGIFPVDGVFLIEEPEVGVYESEDCYSSFDHEACMLIV